MYSRTSMARTLLAGLLCLTRTGSWVPLIPYMILLWSNFSIYVLLLLFLFSIFSDQRSLKIENENNNMKTLTAEVSYIGLGSLQFRFTYKVTLDGWNYLWLKLIFMVPACSSRWSSTVVIKWRTLWWCSKYWKGVLLSICHLLNDVCHVQSPVVQSIVSLTSSLRGQLIRCFTTL